MRVGDTQTNQIKKKIQTEILSVFGFLLIVLTRVKPFTLILLGSFGIRAFHLRRPVHPAGFDEFFGDGSRFTGAADNLNRQVQCPLHAQQPIPHGLFRLVGESQYVLRGVHVAIMNGATTRARPGSHVQRHPGHPMTATATGLACRRPAIHDDRLATVPSGLVFHLPPKLAHAHVCDGAGDVVVLHHALDVKVFQADHVGAANDGGRGLVQEIGAAGGDAGVQLGDADPLVRPPVAALLHPRQPPLLALEVAQLALEVARVAGLPSVAGRGHVADAQIDADGLPCGLHRHDEFLATERHEIPAAGVLAHRHHLWRTGRDSGPPDFERAQLRDFEQRAGCVGSRHLPLVELIADGLFVVAALEARELGAALEEVLERLVLVDERLSQARPRAGAQKLVARFPRKLSDSRVQRAAVNRSDFADFAGLPVDPFAQFHAAVQQAGLLAGEQSRVPNEPRVAELHRQLLALGGVRVEAEPEGFELLVHVENCTMLISTVQRDNRHGQQAGNDHATGHDRVQGAAESAGGSAAPEHYGIRGMAGDAGVGDNGRGRANAAEKAARIGAFMTGGRPAPGEPASAPRATRPVRSLRDASSRRGRHPSMDSFKEQFP